MRMGGRFTGPFDRVNSNGLIKPLQGKLAQCAEGQLFPDAQLSHDVRYQCQFLLIKSITQ